jgi:parallel beta-helix repeat protein
MINRNKKYYQILFLILTFLIIHSSFLIATVRFVSKTGNSTPPYTSWETAADSIQKCINICVFGDTIFVANGVYQEQVVMIPGLSLIGAGTDSCWIDTRNIVTTSFHAVEVVDRCLFKGFYVIVSYNSDMGDGIAGGGDCLITLNKISNATDGILVASSPTVYKNTCTNNRKGISALTSSSIIRKNIVFIDFTGGRGINIQANSSNYKPIIDSNYIEVVNGANGIYKNPGTRSTITNNEIKLINGSEGIFLHSYFSDSNWVHNNLIYTNLAGYALYTNGSNYLSISNNYVTGNLIFYGLSIGPNHKLKNNVVTDAEGGVEAWGTQNMVFQYNNVWDNENNYSGFTPDTTNLSVDPMIVNDDTTQGELDFHLQMFSPLIDAGDPNILDRDGSRSDIGLYGGPSGWTYTYNDLALRPPHNVTATIEEGFVKLTWNKNTEADFSHYRIYRDTVTIVIYDSSKIVGETPDTVFYDNLPPVNRETRFYYVITAFDNQGNQSYPSEEINVLVTGLGEHPPKGYDGYRLLSNYPNPFNPSTVIPYRLKEGGYVKLYVYDVKGELVRVLVNQWQEKGYYEVLFHPNTEERSRANSFEVPVGKTYSDIATGVYLYMIHVYNGNKIPVFSDSGKMILLK